MTFSSAVYYVNEPEDVDVDIVHSPTCTEHAHTGCWYRLPNIGKLLGHLEQKKIARVQYDIPLCLEYVHRWTKDEINKLNDFFMVDSGPVPATVVRPTKRKENSYQSFRLHWVSDDLIKTAETKKQIKMNNLCAVRFCCPFYYFF